jgi:hypothetical protein
MSHNTTHSRIEPHRLHCTPQHSTAPPPQRTHPPATVATHPCCFRGRSTGRRTHRAAPRRCHPLPWAHARRVGCVTCCGAAAAVGGTTPSESPRSPPAPASWGLARWAEGTPCHLGCHRPCTGAANKDPNRGPTALAGAGPRAGKIALGHHTAHHRTHVWRTTVCGSERRPATPQLTASHRCTPPHTVPPLPHPPAQTHHRDLSPPDTQAPHPGDWCVDKAGPETVRSQTED